MPEIKRILVPIDFSEASTVGLKTAIDFAHDYNAELYVLHVYSDLMPVLSMRTLDLDEHSMEEIQKTEAMENIEAILSRFTFRVPVHKRIKKGVPSQEIIRVGDDIKADMIVIATHGRTGLSHVLIGSCAERVVRTSSCPVLTVRSIPLPKTDNGS